MKQKIFSSWSIMRFLRLAAGIAVLIQAITVNDGMFMIAGLVLVAMPVFNIGCCATNGCNTVIKKNTGTKKDISYEELV